MNIYDIGLRIIDEIKAKIPLGTRIRIRAAPPLAPGVRAAVLRGGQAHEPAFEPGPSDSPAFPDLKQLSPGDRVIVRVDHGEMPDYCAWLVCAFHGMPATCSLAPYAPTPGGLFRLHLLAAARIVLPHAIDIEARHDLIGVRLAQVALQLGVNPWPDRSTRRVTSRSPASRARARPAWSP